MKIPKQMKRYCPSCKKHTLQKVKNEKNRGKSRTHPLSRFSKARQELRRIGIGRGNQGRMSRGAMNSWKRFNKKQTKKTDLRYTCMECNKTNVSADRGIRAKKVSVE
jgi:large subunit ribosomal protein L44e